MLEDLKRSVYEANLALKAAGLVTLTWGNASAVDRASGLVVIKPSGVNYETLRPADLPVLDLDGRLVEGSLRPSSDAPSHVVLYGAWPHVGGVVHSHSSYATMFAQAGRPIPCLGTTHADHFCGEIPLARGLTAEETRDDYEANIGRVIVERFQGLDPVAMPGVLAAGHGPFVWGPTVADAVRNAVALEEVARMAYGTLALNPAVELLPRHLLEKHYRRKHGPAAYYGQKPPGGKS